MDLIVLNPEVSKLRKDIKRLDKYEMPIKQLGTYGTLVNNVVRCIKDHKETLAPEGTVC